MRVWRRSVNGWSRCRTETGPHLSWDRSQFPLLLHQLAREALLQFLRQVEAGQLPGPASERKLDAELTLVWHVHRKPDAELADAVFRIGIKLPRVAERIPVRRPEIRRRIAEHGL